MLGTNELNAHCPPGPQRYQAARLTFDHDRSPRLDQPISETAARPSPGHQRPHILALVIGGFVAADSDLRAWTRGAGPATSRRQRAS